MVGFFQATLILIAAVFIYDIPFRGHLILLYGAMLFYSLSLAGVGLFISSLCKTQQQAFLGAFVFMVPAILLSGYTAPVENMPVWLQHITWANPVRHFVEVVKGVFLKDSSVLRVFTLVVPLMWISLANLTAAALMFRRKSS
jgi:ABC-2 type transport system permease protein